MLFNGELIESFKVHSITKAIFGKSEHAKRLVSAYSKMKCDKWL